MKQWICAVCGRVFLDEEDNIPATLTCRICKQGGVKFDGDKLRFDLVPPAGLTEVIKVYTYGAKKYGGRNYFKGMEWSRLYGAIQRHLWAWYSGETIDPESGINHLAHAAWGCLTLLDYAKRHPGLDDRPRLIRNDTSNQPEHDKECSEYMNEEDFKE